MSLKALQSFARLLTRVLRARPRPIRLRQRPRVEWLEDRTLLSAALGGPETLSHPTIPVYLSVAASKAITVSYAVAGGTAVSGKDYNLPAGKLTFNPGDTVKDIPLTILDDGLYEKNKTLQIKLTAPPGVNLASSSLLTYTIQETDATPSIGFSQSSGSGPATQNASLQVALSAPSTLLTTVNYAITGGTAQKGVDFKPTAGTLTFKPGQTLQNLVIPILNSKIDQPNPTIQVSLSSPSNATLGSSSTFTYTIQENNPSPPSVAFASPSASGSESNSSPVIPVALSSVSGRLVTVNYAVSGGSAVSGTDFTLAAGTLTFQPGVKVQNLPLAVIDDRQPGSNKTVQITLSDPSNATPGKAMVFTYTIQENDPNVSFAQASTSGLETTSSVTLPVQLSGVLSQPVTVRYAVTGGTAVNGVNYRLAAGTLTINPNQVSANINLTILDDHTSTAGKTVQVQLSAPKNANLGAFPIETCTIIDADPLPTVGFSQSSSSGPETKNASIPVALSTPSGQAVTVNYAITGGSAVKGVDYQLSAGTLTFKPGQMSQNLTIPLLNDHLSKPDQTLQLTLSAPNHAVLGSNTVFTYTIQNSNSPPSVAFKVAKASGSEASASPSLQVALSAVSGKTITVHYAATGGTAVNGVNYALAPGTLTFNPGDLVKSLPLTILDDGHIDPALTVQLMLDSPSNASLGKNSALAYTILDADTAPSVAFVQTKVSGAESNPYPGLQVSLSALYTRPVTVHYALNPTGTTAVAGVDYQMPASGTLTFNPGQQVQTLPLTIVDDNQVEANETLQVVLSSPSNATLGTNTTLTYTIVNVDPQVGFDTAGPTLVLSSNPAGVLTSSNVTLAGYLFDDLTGVASLQMALDSGPFTSEPLAAGNNFNFSTNLSLTGSDDGSHILHLQATDRAGNVTALDIPFTLITQGPTIQVTSLAPNTIVNQAPILVGQVSPLSDLASLQAAVDGLGFVPVEVDGSGIFSFNAAAATVEGSHVVHLKATDNLNNVSLLDFPFILDRQGPTIQVSSPANNTMTNQAPTLVGQVSDDLSGVASLQVALDSSAFAAVTVGANGNFSYSTAAALAGTGDGTHVIHLQGIDGVGNVTTQDITFTLDTTPPTIALTSPAGSPVTNQNLTISGQVTDALSGAASMQAALDTGNYVPVTLDGSGHFSFATPLATNGSSDGSHTEHLKATDNAGNVRTLDVIFTLDTTSPAITVTNPPANFATNQNFNITGQVTDALDTVSLQAALDTGTLAAVSLDSAGHFSIPTNLALNGSQDGTHVEHLQATDQAGNVSQLNVSFFFKTTPPATPTFDLAAGTADLGPESTSAAIVTLIGKTDPNVAVSVVGTSLAALSSSSGAFQIPGVTLALGTNTLTLKATDVVGNTSTSLPLTVTRGSSPPTANPVIVWNQATLNAIETDGTDPVMASRALAMVQTAVFDAVNNVEGTPAYYFKVTTPADSSVQAAVAAAAHDVLVYLYPAQKATFDTLLTSQLALLPSGQGTTDGETVGQAIGNAVIGLRANDGATNYVNFEPGTAPGDWQPTAPMYMTALDPQAATMTPWALTSPSQFDPAGPPALTSQQWADAVNQVESLGVINSSTRTTAQTTLAQFWNDGVGTYTPAGHWNQIAQTVAEQAGESLVDDARLFAELNISMADAGIATWNTKYLYDTWRPITVIQGGADGVNPAVTANPTWTPLLNTPNFPEYTSGHSAFSMAAATVLDSVFGDNVSFTSTEQTTTLSMTYNSFDQAAQDAGMSRLYGGIHFLFSIQDGWTTGQEVGRWDLASFNIASDTTPPKVTLNNVLPSGASSGNVTITGQVTDNLSGVARLQVQVDGGSYVTLAINAATGGFSYTTPFPLTGTADGRHTINFQATDAAGNVAAAVPFTFTLATQAPKLTLTSPSDGGALTDGSTLTGTVTTDAGVPIVCLCYAFDGSSTMMPVVFNSDGSFNQVLNLSKLAAGTHTLLIKAQDAAGNTTTQTLHLSMAAPIALTVTSLTPADGTSAVGVTFRPKVTFSRPIDTTTLTTTDFFATDPTGAVLPATVVPSNDGTYAWLYFTNPLPAASTITLTVDGSKIKAADGSLLDALGSGVAGSLLTSTFSTVNQAAVPGTSLSGILADPGPDLKPETRDDVRSGPDGTLGTADDIFLRPIQGVKVYILGQEGQAVYTDAQGRFSFPTVPTGDVKLALVGNVPGVMVYDPDQQQFVDPTTKGFYFPEMVMDLTIQPGVANTVMGTMGSRDEQAANATNLGVYLPRVQTAILQAVSTTQATTVDVPAQAAPDLTPQQRQYLSLTVQPNSAIGMDGKVMNDVQIGVSTVPTSLIKDMLPAGMQQPAFTITVQAPGVATFTTPVTLTFPNVYNAPPGTQQLFMSFDHTTGRLEIEGTATVSPDGLSVVTDPDSGLTHPGWHFVISGTLERDVADRYAIGSKREYNKPTLLKQEYPDLDTDATSAATAAAADEAELQAIALTWKLAQPTASKFLYHFLDNSGTPITEQDGSQASNELKSDPNFINENKQVMARLKQAIKAQLPSGHVDFPVALTLTQGDVFSTRDAGILSDLYLSWGSLEGLKLSGEGDISGPNNNIASGTITYDYSTIWGFSLRDKDSQALLGLLGAVQSDARFLQLYGTAQPFIADVKVTMPFSFDLNTDPQVGTVAMPSISQVPGFGTDPSVYYRIVLDNGFEVGGKTNAQGQISNLVLPPNMGYRVVFYAPSTNRWQSFIGTTGASGQPFGVDGIPSTLELTNFGGVDSTGDGLPDIARYVLGLKVGVRSFAGDGIDDATKLEQGLDPLSGLAFPTGVVATLPMPGTVEKLAVSGNQLYAAAGTGGLAIVDGTQFDHPILLSRLSLPGYASGIGVDDNFQIAAVATGSALQLVDISNGMAPRLLQSVAVPASQVVVADGLAYAASGSTLSVVDLESGKVIQSLTLPMSTVTGLARDGNFLYAYGSNTLAVIDITTAGSAMVRGHLGVSIATTDVGVFAANGIVWLAGSGLRTVDVSNPDAPALIHGADITFTARRVALNGSGLGVLAPAGNQFVEVYDTSNPNVTANRLLQIPLAAGASDVAISRGIAYVGENGRLEVVNYLPFDTKGIPPTVSISSPAEDVDPNTAGIQLIQGTSIPITVQASDDVQVRNVELLVNGQVVQNAVAYPFDLNAIALPAGPGSQTVTVQVQATDTGGNSALSNTLTFQLVPDTIPPSVKSMSMFQSLQGNTVVNLRFSKSLAPSTVTAANFQMLNSNGQAVTPLSIVLQQGGKVVNLIYASLTGNGDHLVINSSAVTDLAGNVLTGYTPPVLQSTTPAAGSTAASKPVRFDFNFSEPIAAASLTTQNFTLVDALAGTVIPGQSITSLNGGQTVEIQLAAPLGDGSYRLNVKSSAVTDLNGLLLGFTDTVIPFDVETGPPSLVSQDPANGATRGDDFRVVTLQFSEPMAEATLTTGHFHLVDPHGNPIASQLVQASNGDRTVQVTFGLLSAGTYTFVINAAQLTDRKGNPLGSGDLTSHINVVTPATALFPGQVNYTGTSPVALATGDLNSDGIPDLVTANSSAGTISVLLGLGNGKYRPAVDYPVGGYATGVVLGDVNGDGKLDVIVTHAPTYSYGGPTGSSGVAVLLGNGDGTLASAVQYGLALRPQAVALGDVTGDGKLDIVTANFSFNSSTGSISVLTGKGDGTFAAPVDYAAPGRSTAVQLADVNQDNHLDVLVASGANFGISSSTGNLAVLLNRGDGTFPGRLNLTAGASVQVVARAVKNGGFDVNGSSIDLNGDGIPDLISLNNSYTSPGSAATLTVLLGKGDGTYQPPLTTTLGALTASAVAVGDVNGDGKLDVVVTTYSSDTKAGSVVVLPGKGDGTFATPQSVALGAVSPSTVALGDVTSDGKLDLVIGTGSGFTVLPGNGDGTFGTASSVSLGTRVSALTLGDVNGDGKLDVVATLNSGISNIAVLPGNGDGTFGTARTFSAAGSLVAVSLADMNGDGKLDIVVGGGSTIAVLPGNGDGTFGTAVATAVSANVQAISLGDVNGDSTPDVVAVAASGSSVLLLLGKGNGTFQPATTIPTDPLSFSLVVVSDLNQDGKLDVVLASDSQRVLVLAGDGKGGFQDAAGQASQFTLPGNSLRALVVGDVNGDGKLDALVSNFGYYGPYNAGGASGVAVLLGKGDGTFQPATTLAVGSGPNGLALGDVNGDGKLDLVAADQTSGRVAVLLGKGDGTFQPRSEHFGNGNPGAVSLLDVTGDGKLDIVTISTANSNVAVLVNQGNGTFPGPVIYTGTSPVGLASGDLNGDGIPDLVTANRSDGTISVLLGLGNGAYRPAIDYPVGGNPTGVAIGNVNGDSKLDVIVSHGFAYGPGGQTGSLGLAVLLGNGDGTLAPAVQYATNQRPQAVALGDVTGDGQLDIVTANNNYGTGNSVSVLAGNGDGTFAAAVDYTVSGTPTAVQLADLNHDDHLDIVLTSTGSSGGSATGSVEVLTNHGDGTFPDPVSQFSVPGPGAPQALVVGDINGDGKLDVLTGNIAYGYFFQQAQSSVSVLLGNGDGTLQPATTLMAGSGARGLALGDVNGDGKPDLVVADTSSGRVAVLLGQGGGTFQPRSEYAVPGSPWAISLLDVTGDGKLDIVTANQYTSNVSVLVNQGNGTFPAPVAYTGANPVALVTGDLNGDSIPDLVTANRTAGTISVLLGLGNGIYRPAVDYSVGGNPTAVALGDVSGDGKLDVIVTTSYNYGSGSGSPGVSVLLGQGDGTLAPPVHYATDQPPRAVALGDVTGDGKLDIVTANYSYGGSGSASVLAGKGDGTFATPVDYVAPGRPTGVQLADVNQDGHLDVLLTSSNAGPGSASGNLAVLLNRGDGTFPGRLNPTASNPVQVVARAVKNGGFDVNGSSIDLNGDGIPDLISLNSSSNSTGPLATLTVLLGKGDGTYQPPFTTALGALTATAEAVGDVNGDGKLDVVVTTYSSSTKSGSVLVLLGNGDGTFGTPQSLAVGAVSPSTAALGDVTGDGKLDLVIGTGSKMTVLPGNGDGTFGAASSVSLGTKVSALTLGDVNGDGKLDVVAALSSSGSNIAVLPGNGDGTFGAARSLSAAGSLTAVSLGDMNGDGKLDIVVGGSSGLAVLPGNGDGTFGTAVATSVSSSVQAISLGDVNGDGTPDVVAVAASGSSVLLLLGKGNGTFQPAAALPNENLTFTSVVVSDLNQDGKLDLALASSSGQRVLVLAGDGKGSFQDAAGQASTFAVSGSPQALVVGDVNGDGKLDVLTANSGFYGGYGVSGPSSVSVLLGNGDGTFQPASTLTVGSGPRALALGDVDGDGQLDLVVADTGTGRVAVLLGNGDGTFRARTEYGVGPQPFAVLLLDVTGDGKLDVVTANEANSSVTVLPNIRS